MISTAPSKRRLPKQQARSLRRRMSEILEAIGLVAVLSMFACLPVDCASSVGGRIGRLLGPRLGVSRRALRNLERAFPKNDGPENRRILRAMWDNLGRAFAEYPHLAWICAAESGRVEIVNGQAVTELMAGGRPGIVFGGHFANWEVGPSMIHRLMGTSLLSVYRAANNRWTERVFRHLHGSRRAVAKGARGGRELLAHLDRGGHIAMLVDQKLNDGIAVPFFGYDAMTAPAVARLGLRYHCPILPVRVERLEGARFRFTVLPRLELRDTGDAKADVLRTMTGINSIIEGWVRAKPEHWLWLHRRWAD
ncbi:MAG TPA: lauroyl acyltransferase [Stellaceae bacterium]|nr:lauroyl acyltransferase [Stellaceae bacterium]